MHVLVRFPLLDTVSSVAWGTFVLENKVIPISQKMCWGNGSWVPEKVQIAILVEVAFQWNEKPSSSVLHCTRHSHPTATKFHSGYNTVVPVCFMGFTPPKHPTIVLKEWILTHHSKAQMTKTQFQSVCAIANYNLFLWWTAVNRVFFSKLHVPQDQLLQDQLL